MHLSSLPGQEESSCISSYLPRVDPGKSHPNEGNPGDAAKDAHGRQSRSQVWAAVPFSRGCSKLLKK